MPRRILLVLFIALIGPAVGHAQEQKKKHYLYVASPGIRNYLISASPDTTVLVWSVKAGANLLNNPKAQPKVITLTLK